MSEPVTIWKNSKCIRVSKNLRGILDYARKQPVVRAIVEPLTRVNQPFKWSVEFQFVDGATGYTEWADDRTVGSWLFNRRSWGQPTLELPSDNSHRFIYVWEDNIDDTKQELERDLAEEHYLHAPGFQVADCPRCRAASE